MNTPLYVDGKLFLGRVEEQKQFRAALNEVLRPPPDETLPYIFLLYGDGGMGKTSLAKRFCDIARDEVPFEGEFQILRVDWEDERSRTVRLQGGRAHVSPETVFDILHEKAIAAGWGRDFGAYQRAVQVRGEAQQRAAAALEPGGERDDLAALRGAGAAAIAKILRTALPIGETGEKLAQAFLEAGIRVGAEEAARLRAALERRLRARLNPEQFNLFLQPNEQLARALAEGLQRVARRKPLLLILDTCEIVDRADLWLREVIRAAGARLVWVISGRDDLARSRQFGDEYFKGYAEDFPRRMLAFDMLQLARQDVHAIFADRAPDRPLDEATLQAFSRATRGIPLAIAQAAEMWARGCSLAEIIGGIDESTPRGEVLGKMTARYFLHVPQDDKPALYALALARGDVEILRAMLRPADATAFDLDALLRRLERDYASVHYERCRLHDDPAFFLLEHLKEELQRTDERVQTLIQRAVTALRARLEKQSADLPRLEDRCADEGWVKTALDLAESLFWLDETQAWRWLIPRLVESLAYSRPLRRGLVETAARWRPRLSAGGKKRAGMLPVLEEQTPAHEEQAALLDELTRLERLGWLAGDDEAERRAILAWQRGRWLYARGEYCKALEAYERAERDLPDDGEALKKLLGEALYDLAGEFLWPQGGRGAVYSDLKRYDEALAAYQRAIELDPQFAYPHHGMGLVYRALKRYEEALAAYQRAIELDPQDAYPHYGMGLVYRALGRYEEALAAYQRAIELDPQFAYPHHGMGLVYRALKRYEEALAAYQRAIEIDPQYAAPHNNMGNVYRALGRYEEALAAYRRAIELDPQDAHPHNNMADIFIQQGKFDEARRELNERIRLAPENPFTPLVTLGILARHQGLPESDQHFQDALAHWDAAWRLRWQSPAGLLENKAIALLCLGKKEQALQALQEAIAQMGPGDTIEFKRYTLLQTAPQPTEGIAEMVEQLRAAAQQEDE